MALMKGLWKIVSGTEVVPDEGEAERHAKFAARRDRALAIIGLSVEPTLLYLLGDPDDPVAVWKKLCDHFQKENLGQQTGVKEEALFLEAKGGGLGSRKYQEHD